MSQASLRQFSSVCLWLLFRLLWESHAIVFGHKVFRNLNFVMSNDHRTIHICVTSNHWKTSWKNEFLFELNLWHQFKWWSIQLLSDSQRRFRASQNYAVHGAFSADSTSKSILDWVWIWNRIETQILSFRPEKVKMEHLKGWSKVMLRNKVMLKHVWTILNTSLIEYYSYLFLRNLMPSPELKTFPSKHFGLAQKLFLIYFLNFTFRRKSDDSGQVGSTEVRRKPGSEECQGQADGVWWNVNSRAFRSMINE